MQDDDEKLGTESTDDFDYDEGSGKCWQCEEIIQSLDDEQIAGFEMELYSDDDDRDHQEYITETYEPVLEREELDLEKFRDQFCCWECMRQYVRNFHSTETRVMLNRIGEEFKSFGG